MSVYGYCRVALANEKEMEQQRQRVVHYCRMNHLEADECFCDNGVSGLTLDREGLQQMLNHSILFLKLEINGMKFHQKT